MNFLTRAQQSMPYSIKLCQRFFSIDPNVQMIHYWTDGPTSQYRKQASLLHGGKPPTDLRCESQVELLRLTMARDLAMDLVVQRREWLTKQFDLEKLLSKMLTISISGHQTPT